MSASQLRAVHAGRFEWDTWVWQPTPSFPDPDERRAVARLALQWVVDHAIHQWRWMSDAGVPLAQQQLLAQRIRWNSPGTSMARRLESITQNPYLLAQLPLDLVRGLAESRADWWRFIDTLGRHQLGHREHGALARQVGAVVLGMTQNLRAGHTQQSVRQPTATRIPRPGSWLFQVATAINPRNPRDGMEAAYAVIRLMARNKLGEALPIPYTWDGDRLTASMPAHKDDIAWLAWAGVTWMEQAIRDMVTARTGTPAGSLPDGWETVLSAASLILPPTYREALAALWTRPLTLLTGAAGSGKTTLLRALALLRRHYAPQKPLVLTATTAQAAQRLADVVADGISETERPRTLHRFLAETGQWPTTRRGGLATVLQDGWIIVDEASMADVWVLGRLALATVATASRIVLVGDPHQLAPVGPGAPFANLVRTLDALAAQGDLWRPLNPVVALHTIFRTNRDTIRANAQALLARPAPGDGAQNRQLAPFRWDEASQWLAAPTPADRRAQAVAWARRQQEAGVTQWQIITPRKKDAQAINRELSPVFAPLRVPDAPFQVGDRIMQTVNDYLLGLMNGQQGTVVGVDAGESTLTVRMAFEPQPLTVDWDYARTHWTPAWAITIHKAQGSQWPAVALVWNAADPDDPAEDDEDDLSPPEGPEETPASSRPSPAPHAPAHSAWGAWRVPRNLLYTAFTRAQRSFVFIAPDDPTPFLESLRQSPDDAESRNTRLASWITKTIRDNARQFGPPPGGFVDED